MIIESRNVPKRSDKPIISTFYNRYNNCVVVFYCRYNVCTYYHKSQSGVNVMKFAMYTYFGGLVRDFGFEEALKKAKAIGFSGVEIIDFTISLDKTSDSPIKTAKKYREMAEREGMPIVCYSVGVSLYKAPEVTEALKLHAEVAAALGSPFLHHTLCLGSAGGAGYEDVLADVLPRAIEVADYAKKLGITCIYEDQGMYFNGVEGYGKFFNAIKQRCDDVGICCDFGNILFADCGAPEFIDAFHNDIKHVHFKDYLILKEKDDREGRWHTTKQGDYLLGMPTGQGSVDFKKGFELLKRAGYDGFVSAEQELDFPEPFITDTKQAMVYLNGLFE